MSGRDRVEECLKCVPVGSIAGGEGDRGAGFELATQRFGAGCRGASSGEEKQVLDAVVCDQVAGGERAEGAGAAGDEDGTFWVEWTGDRGRAVRQARESGNKAPAVAQGELSVVGVERGEQGGK